MRISANTTAAVAALASFTLLLAGCTVKVRDGDAGNHSDVDIRTPAGEVSVRSMDGGRETGLPVYPGARETDDGDGPESASVKIGTPWFGIKVAAAEYESDDAPDRIRDFYRDAMSRYGEVVECRGDIDFRGRRGAKRAVCEEEWSASNLKLVVGPEHRQRIVSIKPHSDHTEFAVVYVATNPD